MITIDETSNNAAQELFLAGGRSTGKTDFADSLLRQQAARDLERADWKRRQAIQPPAPTWLAPTLPERINRLNPSERHQLSCLIRSMKLRKIIRRTLAEAFWAGETERLYRSRVELFEPVITESKHSILGIAR